MTKVTEQPIPGQNLGFTPEELEAEHVKIVKEKQKIIADLNKISYPLSVTVFSHGKSWTIRNIAFWKAMQEKDEKVVEFMETYLTESK